MLKRVFSLLPILFSLTLFLSAGLLFLVEPMIAKMILPRLGGTPAVWNTCMVFFQATLLAGYGYAHIAGRIRFMRQVAVHLPLFIVACAVLPIAVSRSWLPASGGSPVVYILLLLLVSVGLPFFVLSSNSLLLQKWFAGTSHPSARDPYFLYSASNFGSMLALIGYPTVIEPHFRLVEQSRLWSGGYALLLILTGLCAVLAGRFSSVCEGSDAAKNNAGDDACAADDSGPSVKERLRWIILAFVPSSLMLGVTTFLSTDVAAIPLFWIVPLSLYLLSFIIVFARVPAFIHTGMVRLLPLSIAALIFVNFSGLDIPKWVIFLFHLVNFFIYCMVCHGEIARSRPAVSHLTGYYLLISVGGVLGGVFNALLAPVAFSIVLEYPLVLALGTLLLPVANRKTTAKAGGLVKNWWKEGLLYVGVPVAIVFLARWSTNTLRTESLHLGTIATFLHVQERTMFLIAVYGALVLLCSGLALLKKPLLFGIGIAALLMTLVVSNDMDEDIVHRERSFFGVLTVEQDSEGGLMSLLHGTTLHGKQWLARGRRTEPLTYYHSKGPVGQVFSEFSGDRKKMSIAVTGLGTGTIASYAGAGQAIDFYEIDPAVRLIAISPSYFTYLTDCRADWNIILGDARLTMEKAPSHHYGMIILDAFSSDAIPVHLLTSEALDLYLSKLEQDGVLLVHISNRYVDLAPVLGKLADDKGLAGMICSDDEDEWEEKNASTWVLLARKESDFGDLARSSDWEPIKSPGNVRVWTDDFSDILSVFKW